jgi:hypothetical protein
MKPSKQHTMQSIVEARRFNRVTTKFLLSVGAVSTNSDSTEYPVKYSFQVETKAGLLLLLPDVFGVYSRFEDVDLARDVLNAKKKWNGTQAHNYFDTTITAEQALDDFKRFLLPLLPPEVVAGLPESVSKINPVAVVVRPPVGPERPAEPSKTGFFTKVAGVSYENRDGTSRQSIIKRCRPGEILHLVREPDNPHDANAVKVLRQNGEQLGYLPGHVVMTGLARELDRGSHFRVKVTAITGDGEETLGVNIKIADVPEASDSEAVGSRQIKAIDEASNSVGVRLLRINPFIYLLIVVAVIVIGALIGKVIGR